MNKIKDLEKRLKVFNQDYDYLLIQAEKTRAQQLYVLDRIIELKNEIKAEKIYQKNLQQKDKKCKDYKRTTTK